MHWVPKEFRTLHTGKIDWLAEHSLSLFQAKDRNRTLTDMRVFNKSCGTYSPHSVDRDVQSHRYWYRSMDSVGPWTGILNIRTRDWCSQQYRQAISKKTPLVPFALMSRIFYPSYYEWLEHAVNKEICFMLWLYIQSHVNSLILTGTGSPIIVQLFLFANTYYLRLGHD